MAHLMTFFSGFFPHLHLILEFLAPEGVMEISVDVLIAAES